VLPDTVQSVVVGRLDRLPAAERQLVRVASALGQRFGIAALEHLLQAPIAAESLSAQGLVRFEHEDGVFAHALMRDGAYASLPRTMRRDLHARAARWFAGRDAILHAEHLEGAEDPGAAHAWLAAARADAAAHNPERVLLLAERGLRLADERGPTRFGLCCVRADALHDLGRMGDAQAAYEAAAAAADDNDQRCRAWLGLAGVLRVRDRLDAAADALSLVGQAAVADGLVDHRARMHGVRGNLLFPRGDLEGCRREHERSLALAREAGAGGLEAAALGGLGDAAFLQGRMLSARRHFDDCVQLASRHGLKRVETANRAMAAITR